MRSFDIPEFYRSPIIKAVKGKRKVEDPRKRDFRPSVLKCDGVDFVIARHFGFCFGVENAIEISYRAIKENPGKRIFLLSQMIHNPMVNEDLQSHGIEFIQDTHGNMLMDWDEVKKDDVVIVPAFGTTLEIEAILEEKGVNVTNYNTTCPFVEKVWKRSSKLGSEDYTVIIHGKPTHEETRATFSHSNSYASSIVIKNIDEAKQLRAFILGDLNLDQFNEMFGDRVTKGFDPSKDLMKVGVVNQTTMLASETQEIADFMKETMELKYPDSPSDHFADTRDTLCYATNDNQQATSAMLQTKADFAIVVGGYNSSNTSHLVELCEQKLPTYYISDASEILSENEINSFNLHHSKVEKHANWLPEKRHLTVMITSGASCPDAVVDEVIGKILSLRNVEIKTEEVMEMIEVLNI